MLASRTRALSIFAVAAALAVPFVAACSGNTSSGSTGTSSDAKPARLTMNVVLLDDQPDPFATLDPPVPAGVAAFQEGVVLGPDSVEYRSFVRLVVQPGETLAQARARAKPWFDARPLPPGDHLIFSEIVEENEVTKAREAVGVRTFVATSKVALTQDDVIDATLGAAPNAEDKPEPVATIQLSPAASERFRQFTKENVLRRIAVVVDGNVIMSARIQGEISGDKIAVSASPEAPYEARRAELQRMVDGLKPKNAPAAVAPTAPSAAATPGAH